MSRRVLVRELEIEEEPAASDIGVLADQGDFAEAPGPLVGFEPSFERLPTTAGVEAVTRPPRNRSRRSWTKTAKAPKQGGAKAGRLRKRPAMAPLRGGAHRVDQKFSSNHSTISSPILCGLSS